MSGSLIHSPERIMRQLLVDLSLATNPADSGDWPAYYGNEVDSPDNLVTVFGAPGRNDGRIQVNGQQQETHGARIEVRATSHTVGYTKARAITVALDESVQLTSVTIDSSVYLVTSVSRRGDVLPEGKGHPTSNLNYFTINALMTLKQTT